MLEDSKHLEGKDLEQIETTTYSPAYSNTVETVPNQPVNLPDGVAQIVAVWSELPEHIRTAIKTLAQIK